MTINDKIRAEKLLYDITKKQEKCQHCCQVKLISMNILQAKKYYLLIEPK